MRILVLILFIISCKNPTKKEKVPTDESSEICTLIDGKYKVIVDESWKYDINFSIEVKGDTLTEKFNRNSIKYLIKSRDKDAIFITRLSDIDTTDLSNLEKMFITQTHFYDNLICTNDTISFSQYIDLNIISLSGKLIKLNN